MKTDLTWPALILYIVLVPNVYIIISPVLFFCSGVACRKPFSVVLRTLNWKNENQPLPLLTIRDTLKKKKKAYKERET